MTYSDFGGCSGARLVWGAPPCGGVLLLLLCPTATMTVLLFTFCSTPCVVHVVLAVLLLLLLRGITTAIPTARLIR